MTIADYCAAMDRSEIKSNDTYQRSSKVWPPAARSFLIESIILGFPLPKIFLFQNTDLVSKKTIKEIVDGQQRSKTIHDFFHDKLIISKTSEVAEARGKKYATLSDDLKGKFLSYQLSIDLFISATPTEIRQAFRRLNSYTVPLNAEELRHADFQGAFKWFVYELTRDREELLLTMGVFTEKQVIRMQDEKLFADCIFTMIHGWKTTKAKELTSLYKDYDKEFDLGPAVGKRFDDALDLLLGWNELHDTALMKPHIFHTLLIAITHYLDPLPSLSEIAEAAGDRAPMSRDMCVTNLSLLADAIESEEPEKRLEPFVKACSGATNTIDQRLARFKWLFAALKPELL
jgi:hypothetical protein